MEFTIKCKPCSGSGYYGGNQKATCQVCKGIGWIIIEGKEEDFIKCKPCSGSGYYGGNTRDTCQVCHGIGLLNIQNSLKRISYMEDKSNLIDTIPMKTHLAGTKIFIVHGTNTVIRDKIDLFLTKDLRLQTVVMQAGAHKGRTLPEKFEQMAKECSFAVFILTQDDYLLDINNNLKIRRARQNVILEVGYFWGALGRTGHVTFLVENSPEMELPTDIQGIGWIPITIDLAETKMKLIKELQAVNLIS
jgi:predicted nucleotide-binding protein